MRTLYLIRHTRPAIADGLCYGQLDIDVAAGFPDEAKRVLGWLPPPDLILTSPLLRSMRLAEHLQGAVKCEMRCDARLMEKHFGAWEGRAWEDIPRAELDAWAADIMAYAPPQGESATQLQRRVHDLLLSLSGEPASLRRIALVTHGGSIRAILSLLAGIPLADTLKWQIDFGAVIAVRRIDAIAVDDDRAMSA